MERNALQASSRRAVPLLCVGSTGERRQKKNGNTVSISGAKVEDEKWGRQRAKQSLSQRAFNPKEGPNWSLLGRTQTALLSPALRGPEVWAAAHHSVIRHSNPSSGLSRVSPASRPRVALGRKRTSWGQAREGHVSAPRVLRSLVVSRMVWRVAVRMRVSRGGSCCRE